MKLKKKITLKNQIKWNKNKLKVIKKVIIILNSNDIPKMLRQDIYDEINEKIINVQEYYWRFNRKIFLKLFLN